MGAQWPDFNQIRIDKEKFYLFIFGVVKSHKRAKEELISCPKFPELHREQHSRRHEQTNLLYECHVTSLLCYDRLIPLNVSGIPPMGKFQVPTLKDGRQEFQKKIVSEMGEIHICKSKQVVFFIPLQNKQNSTPRLQKLIFWDISKRKVSSNTPDIPYVGPPSTSRPPDPAHVANTKVVTMERPWCKHP